MMNATAKCAPISRMIWITLSLMLGVLLAPTSSPAQGNFTIVHTPLDYTPRSEPLTIQATIQPKSDLRYATVYYRRPGNASYGSAFMKEGRGSNFTVEIPANQVTGHGIEYYISIRDKTDAEKLLYGSPTEPVYVSTKNIAVLFTRRDGPNYGEVLDGIKSTAKGRLTEYYMEGDRNQGEAILKQAILGSQKADLIISVGKLAAELCKKEVDDVPVVFTMVSNPFKLGLNNKENMTGVSVGVPVKTQMQTFKSVVPNIKRVGVIYDPDNTGDMIAEATITAPFQLVTAKVDSATEVERALRAFSEGIDAYWLLPDSTVASHLGADVILKYTIENKIPLFVPLTVFVSSGALVSLTPDFTAVGKQTAAMANEIMRGKSPGFLSVRPPEKFKVTLNSKTAKTIGVDQTVALQLFRYAAEKGYQIETVN